MNVLKGVLEEELQHSLRQEAAYRKALAGLPVGVIVRKRIKGHEYHYLMFRDQGKVKFVYKGRLPENELRRYDDAKKKRAQYRKHLKVLGSQIAFLRKALRAREIRAVR